MTWIPLQVLLPALRADMASIPLPSEPACLLPSQPDRPISDMSQKSQGVQQQAGRTNRLTKLSGAHTSMDIDSDASHSTSVVAASLQQTSGFSTASDMAAGAVDESPIRPIVKQTSSGSCVSPIIGRRTTAFSSSSASSLESEDPVPAADAPETLQAVRSGSRGSQSRSYLTCCVRLSPEKEPHR